MTRNSFADGAGGMSDVRRTRPEPTAIAPPISTAASSTTRTSSATVRRRPRTPADRGVVTAPARICGLTAMRRSLGPLVPSVSSRSSTSLQTSGTGTRSSVANRWRRSSIAITQKLSETTSAPAEVGADGQAVRPESGCDVADRQVGVVEEDHCGSLGVRELSKGSQEVWIAVSVFVLRGSGGYRWPSTASLQGARRDPEGGAPGPGGRVTDGCAPVEDLGVGFGDRVAGDVSVTGKCVDGAPEPLRVGSIHGFDALMRFRQGHGAVHQ